MALGKEEKERLEFVNYHVSYILKYDKDKFWGPLAYASNAEKSDLYDNWIKYYTKVGSWLECLLKNTRPSYTENLLHLLEIYPKRKYFVDNKERECYIRPFDYVCMTYKDFLNDKATIAPISSEDWFALVKSQSKHNSIWLR